MVLVEAAIFPKAGKPR